MFEYFKRRSKGDVLKWKICGEIIINDFGNFPLKTARENKILSRWLHLKWEVALILWESLQDFGVFDKNFSYFLFFSFDETLKDFHASVIIFIRI